MRKSALEWTYARRWVMLRPIAPVAVCPTADRPLALRATSIAFWRIGPTHLSHLPRGIVEFGSRSECRLGGAGDTPPQPMSPKGVTGGIPRE